MNLSTSRIRRKIKTRFNQIREKFSNDLEDSILDIGSVESEADIRKHLRRLSHVKGSCTDLDSCGGSIDSLSVSTDTYR